MKSTREIAESMLEMAGATLDIAHDGAQAVAMFDGQAPQTYDAILMDIQMPVMDGAGPPPAKSGLCPGRMPVRF